MMKRSVIILAGGMSSRMGTDKAFLSIGVSSFLELIVSESLTVSSDVVIAGGMKNVKDYRKLLQNEDVHVFNDETCVHSPLSGIVTGLNHVKGEYAAVLACDLPLVKSSLLTHLFSEALGHDAAVPTWDIKDKMSTEPLCAVYRVESTRSAVQRMLEERKNPCKKMILQLSSVNFVPMSELRAYDNRLDSFRNINTKNDYADLLAEIEESQAEVTRILPVEQQVLSL